jgi:internalin A
VLVKARLGKSGIEELGKLDNVIDLMLDDTTFSNASLRSINKMKSLEVLSLNGNKGITDSGLDELRDLKNLKLLQLSRTSVTDQGVKRLKKRLPTVSITYD